MKFLIQPHVRLQEWVAEEHGYFREAGLDYEFEPQGLAGATVSTSSVKTADEAPTEVTSGAFEGCVKDGFGFCAQMAQCLATCPGT